MANKPTDTPTGYMIAQCQSIILDENETPARRKLAEKWYNRLVNQTDCWEGGGRTKAEAVGISVPNSAPGGARLYPGEGTQRSSKERRQRENVDGGALSSEVSGGYRSGRWAAERGER